VAATNTDLDSLVRDGSFREDLYYRIDVLTIEIPPLRERLEDIPLLVEHFIDRFNAVQGKTIVGISEDAMSCLMAYDYPGNVRELENIVERAFILCRADQIGVPHLPEHLRRSPHHLAHGGERLSSFDHVEASLITAALEQHGWNCTETARSLGIHRTTLYRKMKSLGIERPSG
jgi:DNA-binding NtrC family response regulator